jgi:predicted pyridoxine 5'-phosphate oxidase superfamily flavin-nucleotide-binding protein
MKRLLLISLTSILSISSLATVASADRDWSKDREGYPNSYHQQAQPETTKLSPIPEPLRYRVERVPEPVETAQTQHNDRRQTVDPYEYNEYRRERRRIRFRRYHHGSRNDPGRY